MRGNTAHRLRLTLQGGCSTPRLIPQGRGISSPAPSTRALLRLGALTPFQASKGTLEGSLLRSLPGHPIDPLSCLPAGCGSALRRYKREPSALPFWIPHRPAHPALGRHHRDRLRMMTCLRPLEGAIGSTPCRAVGAPRIASLLTPPAYPRGRATPLFPPRPHPTPSANILWPPRSPAPIPYPPARPCPARRPVRRTI